MIGALARSGDFDHPVLDGNGWWREEKRFEYPPFHSAHVVRSLQRDVTASRPILVTGAAGTLGSAFAMICEERGIGVRAVTRAELDIADANSIESLLGRVNPWAIVNAAGYVRVDDAERDFASCHRANADGAISLAHACEARRIKLVTFSSDLVFDGHTTRPYTEHDRTNPGCVYGRSKAVAESVLLSLRDQPLIIRTGAFFGPWDAYNFLTTTLSTLANGVPVEAAEDLIVSPTYVPDLVHTTLDLLIDDERGIWHLANAGETNWADFGRSAADAAGLDPALIIGRPASELGYAAPRPRYSALASARGTLMPPLDDAIARYAAEYIALAGAYPQTANA
jgi:dTDP-4-dehydrorhamnose reductase